ncbi:protein toll-like isoform X2 [Mizuhopecten yessoensis]|nr:protein toll-like isoform X2 [Mizuhopecten yessoensis]
MALKLLNPCRSNIELILRILVFLSANTLVTGINQCQHMYSDMYSVCKIENSTLPELCCINNCCNVETSCPSYTANQRCVCRTGTLWKISELHALDVEYTTVRGSAIVSGQNDVKSKLEHEAGYLTTLPINICDYHLLYHIDLKKNKIREIRKISCLAHLDTLDLSENRVSIIHNNTFQGLLSLRQLNLAHNMISYIEPYSWSHQTSSILNLQLDDNDLLNIDITNVIINRPFCKIDYRQNKIQNVINEVDWTLTAKDEIVQGGFVDLTENSLTGVIDFLHLGVADLRVLGKIFSYGIDIRDIPLRCDCKMEPFLHMAESVLQLLWRSYFNMCCFYPDQLQNQSVPNLIMLKQFDLFVCDIPRNESCPYDCNCYTQPSKNRVVVNCSGHGLDKMPEVLPRKDLPLEIYLDNNSISRLSWRGYLNQTRKLVLSNNIITTIDGSAIDQLQNATEVDLRGNTGIKKLPSEIQYYKPSTFIFGELKINCDCENVWFGKWIEINHNEKGDNNHFWCQTVTNAKEAAELVTEDYLDCEQSKVPTWIPILFAILTSLVLGIALIIKLFKYEIYLLFRRLRNKYERQHWSYDVYILYDESVNEIHKWIINDFLPSLEADGYLVCLPSRDFSIGIPYEEEFARFMEQSKFVLIVLSKNERNVLWDLEWKQAWYSYRYYNIKSIIVINFDMFDYASVHHPVLRAYIRLGMYLDFSNMEKSLIIDTKKMLGCSSRTNRRLKNEFCNPNTRFKRHDLLMKR